MQRTELVRAHWGILVSISVGGAIGAIARWGIATAFPTPPAGFPWATFAINVTGCLLIGILMVLVTDAWAEQTLIRPFLGVGVLGGYTTFSTYIVDIQRLIDGNAAAIALAYLTGTILAALCATTAGIAVTRFAIRRLRTEMETSR